MSKFIVEIELTNRKELTIYANDEDEAREKVKDLVCGWTLEEFEILEIVSR